jgi:hypothetical protein
MGDSRYLLALTLLHSWRVRQSGIRSKGPYGRYSLARDSLRIRPVIGDFTTRNASKCAPVRQHIYDAGQYQLLTDADSQMGTCETLARVESGSHISW